MRLVIKICGLRTPEALDVSLHAGADMVGFVFFAPSPRHVDFATARELGARVRGRALKVALSVDADDEWLAASIEALSPNLLQLHGKETPKRVLAVKARFRLPVMKAIAVETRTISHACRSMPRSRTGSFSMRGHRATPRDPAASAMHSNGGS